MEIVRNIALVFLGGGLGASVRYGLTVGLGYAGVSSYIVLVGINLTGSLLIGLLVGLGLRDGMGVWWFLLAVGILGGFTTLSTFSIQVIDLFQKGNVVWALGYIVVTLVGGIALALLGVYLGGVVFSRPES